ncbi:MAG TPA: DNA polymerase III subunit beta [Planctomycetaceae bacterium]|nr:DNA polymerase III subunit beta [Planctomycetaceae bacterium]
MKLTCQRGPLAAAFTAVSAVVPSRTPKQILQNVKLRTQGSETILIGTDQEVGIRYTIPEVQASGEGEVLLPTASVIAILRELRDEVVTLEIDGDLTLIKSGHSEFKLPAIDPTEFPNVAAFDDSSYYVAAGAVLKEMIRRTIFATDPESTRYPLGGILLELTDSKLGMVATDSRRLAVVHAACSVTGTPAARPMPPVVPIKAMSLLERSITDADESIQIAIHQNEVLFKTVNSTIYSRLLEGRFPKYQDVIPSRSEIAIDLVAAPFHAAVRQAQIVTNPESRGVNFTFDKGALVLTSQSAEVGQSRVELPIAYDGAPLTITFDPRFVADFLKVLEPEKSVQLNLTDGDSAAVLKTEDGYTYVIMPLARDR